MQLTKTLLKTHFGLEMALPKDRLCPPVSILLCFTPSLPPPRLFPYALAHFIPPGSQSSQLYPLA